MADPAAVARLSAALVASAGGYLRNPVRQELLTCAVCATPVTGFRLCYQCQRRRGRAGLADATGFLAYAVAGRQSGYVMQGYKARPLVPEHRTIVTLLVLLGLARHAGCAGLCGLPGPAGQRAGDALGHGALAAGPAGGASAARDRPPVSARDRGRPGRRGRGGVFAGPRSRALPGGAPARGRARPAGGRHMGSRRARAVRGPGLTGGWGADWKL